MEIDAELFSVAFQNLKSQKLRSTLTLLGIVIGIGAIVALVSIGEGLNQAVNVEFEKMGMDTLTVQNGSELGMSTAITRSLKEEDLGIIENIPGVESVMGFYETAGIAEFKKKQTGIFIIGIEIKDQEFLEKAGYVDIIKGRFLKPNDRYALIIPESFANDAFYEESLRVKDQLEINGQNFKIIGISKDMTGIAGGFTSNMLWFPKKTVQDFFGEEDPTEIMVKATDRSLVNEVAEKIEERLLRAHGEDDFTVMTTENIMEMAGVVLGLIQTVLVALAAISLVVGGIGIMNTMLMSVMERTKEIGVMKAIGATNNLVLSMFLAEAALIGGIGGIMGVVFGLFLSSIVSFAAEVNGFALPIGINVAAMAGAVAFAMAVGMVSGYMPARKASMLEPVEALRYGK